MADVQWQVINDFSPGIHQRVSPNHPPGAAQEGRTYRCHSQKSGALIPLPSLDNVYTPDPADMKTDPGATIESEEYRIVGLLVNNPVFWDDNGTGIYQNNSEIYVAYEHWEDTGGGLMVQTVMRYKRNFVTTPTWEQLGQRTYSQAFDPIIRPKKCEFITIRSNPADPNEAGPMVVAWVYNGWAQIFPDPSAPTVNGTAFMPGDNVDDPSASLIGVDGLVSHQGRAVIFPLTVLAVGFEQLYTTNEAFYWMNVNDAETMDTSVGGSYFKTIASYDNPTGYQVYQSLTANEFLLIKAKGGALVVEGNLNDFRVRNMPNVRGTGHSMNRGSTSPKGFVYPIDGGGLWLWEGGDISTHLTDNMEPDFWRPEAVSPANGVQSENLWGYQYSKCCDWNQFVMLPNNWLWDTDFGGFWRIDNTEDYVIHQWDADWRGLCCYGTPSGVNDDVDISLYEFNKVIPATSYSWESHPLPFSQERTSELRFVQLVASGIGDVTISLRSSDDDTGNVNHTFTLDGSVDPYVREWSTSIKGSHFTVQIESDGDTGVAPTVHEIRLGEINAQMVVRD